MFDEWHRLFWSFWGVFCWFSVAVAVFFVLFLFFTSLVEFMYLVFTHMPGESYRRRLWSLSLYLSIFTSCVWILLRFFHFSLIVQRDCTMRKTYWCVLIVTWIAGHLFHQNSLMCYRKIIMPFHQNVTLFFYSIPISSLVFFFYLSRWTQKIST